MPYRSLIVGDVNVARVWQAAQLARPQLVGVPLKVASCLDTLVSGLADVTDELDYVLVSVLNSMLLEEGSAADVSKSCSNIVSEVLTVVNAAAKKSSRVEVLSSEFLLSIFCCQILL